MVYEAIPLTEDNEVAIPDDPTFIRALRAYIEKNILEYYGGIRRYQIKFMKMLNKNMHLQLGHVKLMLED